MRLHITYGPSPSHNLKIKRSQVRVLVVGSVFSSQLRLTSAIGYHCSGLFLSRAWGLAYNSSLANHSSRRGFYVHFMLPAAKWIGHNGRWVGKWRQRGRGGNVTGCTWLGSQAQPGTITCHISGANLKIFDLQILVFLT